MKVDLYTKIVLTIIAVCLSLDATQRMAGTRAVLAQSAKSPSEYRNARSKSSEPKPIHVIIDDVEGTAGALGIPVREASPLGIPVRIEGSSTLPIPVEVRPGLTGIPVIVAGFDSGKIPGGLPVRLDASSLDIPVRIDVVNPILLPFPVRPVR